MYCEINRVSFRSVLPYYTSTTCYVCGHSDRGNRNGEIFLCLKCEHKENADINAGKNIEKEGIRILINDILSRCVIKDWNRISPPNRLEKLNSFLHCA